MALVRWESAREMASLQQEMNRLFGNFLDSGEGGRTAGTRHWIPAMDLVETPAEYVLRADLPGMNEENISIELDSNVLTISGERAAEHEEKAEGYYRIERSSGRFSRSLTLPDGVQGDGIRASFDRGVLEVRVAKPEQRKPHRVEISASGRPETIEAEAAATPEREHATA